MGHTESSLKMSLANLQSLAENNCIKWMERYLFSYILFHFSAKALCQHGQSMIARDNKNLLEQTACLKGSVSVLPGREKHYIHRIESINLENKTKTKISQSS